MEVFNQWLAAKLHLENAISEFFKACIKLRSVGPQAVASYSNRASLEDVLHQIQCQIGTITTMEKCLHESRAVVNGLLNASTSRVPIHRLPPETLSRIFSIAVSSTPCSPKRTKRDALLDIPLVCVRWRQTATNNRSLWSHIDIDISFSLLKTPSRPTFNRTRRWLELSRGLPIHLHFSERDSFERVELIPELISILAPYATFFGSIKVSGTYSSPWAKALLALYSSHGEPSSLKTLRILRIRESHEEDSISWPTKSLQALVHLELDGLWKFACPSSNEIVTMLSNCPALQTLRLRHLSIRDTYGQFPSAISLPHLRVLDLGAQDEAGLTFLLPMLSPGTAELAVRLELAYDSYDEPPPHVQSLLARSNVVLLAICTQFRPRNTQHTSYLPSVPRLRVLYLDLKQCGNAYVLDEFIPSTQHDPMPLVPCLESLCITNGDVDQDVMRRIEQLLAVRSLHQLAFLSCSFPQAGADDNQEGDIPIEEYAGQMPESMRERLSRRVEKVIIDDMPPAKANWGFDLLFGNG